MSAAQDAIRALMAQGLTQAQIGAAVGRDRSQISQIARGKYPGNNLAPTLSALVEGRVARPPAHRLGGDVPSAAWVREGGLVTSHQAAAGVRRTLANVARGSGHVKVTVHGVDGSGNPVRLTPWRLTGRNREYVGIRAQRLRELIDARLATGRPSAEDTSRALAEVLADLRSGDVGGSALPAGFVIQSVSVETVGG